MMVIDRACSAASPAHLTYLLHSFSPYHQYLSHIGSDLSRSLLIFDEGKPLGDKGLQWLKIHLANLYGKDKCTIQERIQFVDENIDNVRASGKNPLSFLSSVSVRGGWIRSHAICGTHLMLHFFLFHLPL